MKDTSQSPSFPYEKKVPRQSVRRFYLATIYSMLLVSCPALIAMEGCGGTKAKLGPPSLVADRGVTTVTPGDRYLYQATESRAFVKSDNTTLSRNFTGTLRLTRERAPDVADQIVESVAVTGTYGDGTIVGGLTQTWIKQEEDGIVRLRAKQTNKAILQPFPSPSLSPSPIPSESPSPSPSPSPILVPPSNEVLFLLVGNETGGEKITADADSSNGEDAVNPVGSAFLPGPGKWPDLTASPSPGTDDRDISGSLSFSRPDDLRETVDYRRAVTGEEFVEVGKTRYRAYVVSESRTVTLKRAETSRVVSVAVGTYRFVPRLRAFTSHEESYTLFDSEKGSIIATGTLNLRLTETNVLVGN